MWGRTEGLDRVMAMQEPAGDAGARHKEPCPPRGPAGRAGELLGTAWASSI